MKKHHFWIVLGVAGVLLPLGLWFYGVSNVRGMTETERGAREQMHSRVAGVRPANHLNDKFKDVVDGVQKVNSQHVYNGWEMRYNAQKTLVDTWPDWLPANYIDQIETAIKEGKEIPASVRQAYLNRIREEFPRVYESIKGGLRTPATPGGGSDPGPMGTPLRTGNVEGRGPTGGAYSGLLAWSPDERGTLEQKLGGGWSTPPTHDQMIYTQETLNIYRALIENILNPLNAEASEHHQANIKKIQSLQVGADAEPLPVTAAKPVAEGATPDESGEVPAQGGQTGAARGERAVSENGLNAPDGKLRFVDAFGYPVVDQKLSPPFAEFRMLPVSMSLVMDHRKIPDLLALCANSPLPLEVRQVNVTAVGGVGVVSAGAHRDESVSMIGGNRQSGRDTASANRTQLDAEVELGSHDMVVEIRGLIYLFNRPDQKLIGTGTAAAGDGEATGEEPPAPATVEAAEPPPAAVPEPAP